MITVCRVQALLLGLMLAGCGTVVPEAAAEKTAKAPETLGLARALWDDKSITNYQITIQKTCFCPADLRQPMRATVAGGKLIEVKGLEQPIQNKGQLASGRLTIDGLFEFIEQSAQRDVYKLNVDYDTRYGFPRRIDYDGHKMMADDEYQYELSDFRAGAAH